ncbi:putative sporulation sigma-E factor-processing peptidase [Clostridiaceae bacterium BL-3]|nr:putative sporulation sigma-E factor-processing peptidase [Clostridiaceae bacterium BL-3]
MEVIVYLIVYIDLLILINLIVDFFLLYITGRTLKLKIKFKFMFLAASIGSIYTITLIYPNLEFFSAFYFKIIVSIALIYISFGNKGFITNLKIVSVFILYSMLLAGLCIFIQYNKYSYVDGPVIINFSYQWLFTSLMILYMVIDRLLVYVKDRNRLSTLIYSVDIVFKNKCKTVRAFLDTGNELREPVTNLPVIIVESSVFKNINLEEDSKFYIPYRVINGEIGKLQGFKADAVRINLGGEIKYREAVIAICQQKLSELGDYHALLSRGVI